MAELKEFNNLEAMSGFISVLVDIVGEDMGKFVNPNTGEATTSPAIYIGRANDTAPNFPRISLTYQGSDDGNGHTLDTGLIDVEDPNNPPEIITIPFTSKFITYGITLTCESGGFDEVLKDYVSATYNSTKQLRLSSEQILGKIRKSFLRDSVKKKINTNMNSSVQLINTIVPVPYVDETEYQDSSTMTVFFTTVDVELEYETLTFNTIQGNYSYRRTVDDQDPLTGTTNTTSVDN